MVSLFSLGDLEWQAPLEEGDKSAGYSSYSASLTPALVSMSYFGLLFSKNFKAGFCFRNRRIECQKY